MTLAHGESNGENRLLFRFLMRGDDEIVNSRPDSSKGGSANQIHTQVPGLSSENSLHLPHSLDQPASGSLTSMPNLHSCSTAGKPDETQLN